MQNVSVIVVIPIGPNTSVAFIEDTIDSYAHYATTDFKIILSDDSQQGIGAVIQQHYPDCDMIVSKKAMGGWAGLYIMLANAFAYAVKNYHFKVLLKLDTDALVIGSAPEKEAIELFEKHPEVGIAGQYPYDYNGKVWDISWPRERILNGTRTWRFIKRPIANLFLTKIYNQALKNGYRTGESVFGGAYFMSYRLLSALLKEGFLPHNRLITLNLGEDHIFSILAKATGFDLASLSTEGKPFGCAWKGLPVSPEQLERDKRKIIHSVRYWNEMKESDIRAYFRQKREWSNVCEAEQNS